MYNDCGTSIAHMHLSMHMHMLVNWKEDVDDERMPIVRCHVVMFSALYDSSSSLMRSECFPLCRGSQDSCDRQSCRR